MFKVTKGMNSLSEHSKLEFIKVHMFTPTICNQSRFRIIIIQCLLSMASIQEIGFTHMRVLEGVQSLLQLSGCVARLCKINMKPSLFVLPAR